MKFFVAFIFIGWLALAAMSARIFREPIEADLTSQARLLLDQHGLESIHVSFDHLDATLSGNVSTKELKQSAHDIVERIEGARVIQNQITFGKDISPRLVFVAGQPVKVSGLLDIESAVLSIGNGFDLGEVTRGECSGMSWEKPIGDFAQRFFERTSGGRIELDGRQVKLEGEVLSSTERWALVDEADGMAIDLDVIDLLTVSEPTPFEIGAAFEDGAFKFSGSVRDGELLDRFASAVSESDVTGVGIDPTSISPPWLAAFPAAVRLTLDRAIDTSFQLTPAKIEVNATFENEFWKTVAEQSLRDGLPEGIDVVVNYQVAQKAVAEVPADDDELKPLPIKIMIAGSEMRIEGRVRLKEERDQLLAKLKQTRPDLKIESALKYDWREPKFDSLRDVYPAFIAYVISRVERYGSLELHQDRWEVDVNTLDSNLAHWLGSIASASRNFVGVPCSVTVRGDVVEEIPEDGIVLEDFPIYFKPLSAQIKSIQSSKLESLAATLVSLDRELPIILLGYDRGDGSLALQRARAVRRSLVNAGLPFDSFELRSERPEGDVGWKSEKVLVEIPNARSVEDA